MTQASATEEIGKVRVEIESQVGTSHRPAYVRVYQGDLLVAVVRGTVGLQKGADGGYYDCVELRQEVPT